MLPAAAAADTGKIESPPLVAKNWALVARINPRGWDGGMALLMPPPGGGVALLMPPPGGGSGGELGVAGAAGCDWDTPLAEWKPRTRQLFLEGDAKRHGLLTLLEQEYATATQPAARERLEAFRGEVRGSFSAHGTISARLGA